MARGARLVEHGARTTLQDAATLGLPDRVRAYVESDEPPSPADITSAFRGACHGGHLSTAQYLRAHCADIDRRGHDGLTPLDIARRENAKDAVRHGAAGPPPSHGAGSGPDRRRVVPITRGPSPSNARGGHDHDRVAPVTAATAAAWQRRRPVWSPPGPETVGPAAAEP